MRCWARSRSRPVSPLTRDWRSVGQKPDTECPSSECPEATCRNKSSAACQHTDQCTRHRIVSSWRTFDPSRVLKSNSSRAQREQSQAACRVLQYCTERTSVMLSVTLIARNSSAREHIDAIRYLHELIPVTSMVRVVETHAPARLSIDECLRGVTGLATASTQELRQPMQDRMLQLLEDPTSTEHQALVGAQQTAAPRPCRSCAPVAR